MWSDGIPLDPSKLKPSDCKRLVLTSSGDDKLAETLMKISKGETKISEGKIKRSKALASFLIAAAIGLFAFVGTASAQWSEKKRIQDYGGLEGVFSYVFSLDYKYQLIVGNYKDEPFRAAIYFNYEAGNCPIIDIKADFGDYFGDRFSEDYSGGLDKKHNAILLDVGNPFDFVENLKAWDKVTFTLRDACLTETIMEFDITGKLDLSLE